MTGLVGFIGTVLVLSLSGALMPGPVTAVTLARGSKSPYAGALVALGHLTIEWPLMGLIFFGVGELFQIAAVKIGLGLAGGAILGWMGIGMLRDRERADLTADATPGRSPFLAGILLTAGNPYFLIWWATAGAVLVKSSLAFGLAGIFILAVVHWLVDLGWLSFLSTLSFFGGKFYGRRLQHAVFIICGLGLLYFAGRFAVGAVMTLWQDI
jgi:threonine/homoserine/homoserine lactone efflux protein